MSTKAKQDHNPGQGWTPMHGAQEIGKWETEGQTVDGIFLGLDDGSMGGKLVRLQTGEGVETYSAPTTLVRALEPVKLGVRVKIIYLGSQPSKTKGHNPLKLFEVYAKNS